MDISLSPEGGLLLTVPSPTGDRTHSVKIPLTLNGVNFLHHLLIVRSKSSDQRIGTAAAPTQEMVDAFLAKKRADEVESAKAKYPSINLANLKVSL